MGYCSEVAYVIETDDAAKFLEDFLAQSEYDREDLEGLKVGKERLTFHEDGRKWYAKRLFGIAEYRDVEAHEALVAYAQDHEDICRGGFVRIGEELPDMESFYWSDDPYDSTYELIDLQRSIFVAEEN